MQPNDNIFIADQACGPEQISGINLPNENIDSDNNNNNLATLSYEYMIYSDDDSLSENDNSNKRLSKIEKYRSKLTKSKRLQNDGNHIDFVSQKPDVLIKYITILLKDAVQKEQKIKRLQAEFEQRSREVADLKEYYEKLKRRR